MSLFLRKIDPVKWESERLWKSHRFMGCVLWKKFYADILSEMQTDGQTLSIWRLEDNLDNLDRLVALLSIRSNDVQEVGYLLLKSTELQRCKLTTHKSDGISPDAGANTEWHYDLVELCVDDVVNLAKLIEQKTKAGNAGIFFRPQVLERVANSLRNKWINEDYINKKVSKSTRAEIDAFR